ncbi:MAG: disulfide bond formation protein B [Acetobacteraceae bacterium]
MMSVRACGAFLFLLSILALATAWFAERVIGLPPCELCLLERIPWKITFFLGAVALLVNGRVGAIANVTAIPMTFVGVVLSAINIGVEQKWWESPFPACHAPVFKGGSFSQHLAAMPPRPVKPCDAPIYLFHLPFSMALMGGAVSLVVMIALVYWAHAYFTTSRKRFRHSASFR